MYFLYGPPFKHLWSLSEVHVQYILPVNEPSLEDDWLRAIVRERGEERERESGRGRGTETVREEGREREICHTQLASWISLPLLAPGDEGIGWPLYHLLQLLG